VELRDVTDRLGIEQELQTLVDRAIEGDFSHRIANDRTSGFMRDLATRMNQLVATVERSLSDLLATTTALAEGDLTYRVTNRYQGMFAKLMENANTMAERLQATVDNIVDAAHEVESNASEITVGAEKLSARTEQQAANLQQTAAAMEELTATVRQNAEN